MAGLTDQGFTKKTLQELKTEMEESFRTSFGLFINLLPSSVFATIIGIMAERYSSLWDLAQEIYNAMYPATATGINLDNAASFTGVERLEATFTVQRNQLFFGTPGTVIPTTTQISVEENPNSVFQPVSEITLVAGVNEVQNNEMDAVPTAGSFKYEYRGETTAAIPYTANAAAIQSALNNLLGLSGVVVTGTIDDHDIEFAGDDGLQDQPLLEVVENSLTNSGNPVDTTITVTTPGVPQGIVDLRAIVTGPITAPAGTLNQIDTPVSGLARTINTENAIVGRNQETDSEYRLRRDRTLQLAGSSTPDAIRSRLLNIEGVTGASIFENEEITTVSGRPPKSYESVVEGGEEQDIADAIWISKPAGIKTHGSITTNVTDSQGNTRQVKWSRPTGVPIYVSIDLTVDPELFPDNGTGLAQSAIVTWGNSLQNGQDVVVYPKLVAQLDPIPGILDMIIRIDDAPVSTTPGDPAVDNNIPISPSQKATFAEANTDINIL